MFGFLKPCKLVFLHTDFIFRFHSKLPLSQTPSKFSASKSFQNPISISITFKLRSHRRFTIIHYPKIVIVPLIVVSTLSPAFQHDQQPKLQNRNLKNQYPYSAKCRFYRNSNDNIFNKETSQSRRLISKIFNNI